MEQCTLKLRHLIIYIKVMKSLDLGMLSQVMIRAIQKGNSVTGLAAEGIFLCLFLPLHKFFVLFNLVGKKCLSCCRLFLVGC